jgi:hypothetical protein
MTFLKPPGTSPYERAAWAYARRKEEFTLANIGRHLHVTPERVRQIIFKFHRRLWERLVEKGLAERMSKFEIERPYTLDSITRNYCLKRSHLAKIVDPDQPLPEGK